MEVDTSGGDAEVFSSESQSSMGHVLRVSQMSIYDDGRLLPQSRAGDDRHAIGAYLGGYQKNSSVYYQASASELT